MADTEQLKRIREGLKCSESEAQEILAYDKQVDKATANERLEHDLSLELEKEAVKMARATERKKPTNYQFTKRERKTNDTKASIIFELSEFLKTRVENLTIVNTERVISFSSGDNNYELTLTQKRKPK